MRRFNFLLSVVLLAGLAACSPEYIEPLSLRSENASVTLREGDGTLTGDKEPLIVVNGEVVKRDALVNMDPNRIASISVFKGATVAALYGSKSKNGVIVITLKSNK